MNMQDISTNEAKFVSQMAKLTNANTASMFLQDDVAHLENNIIVTTDTTIEGVHILKGLSSKYIAYKAMARSVSDAFAKGGKPIGYFLNIILPKNFTEFDKLINGFEAFNQIHKIDLLGGDTSVHGNEIIIAVTVLAKVEEHITRFNAKVGDGLYLTKKIGSAFLGFIDCQAGNIDTENAREYLTPSLINDIDFSYVNASMDVSDGLLIDAHKLGRASQKCMEIDFSLLPFGSGVNLQEMLSFGDDYNILLASAMPVQKAVKIGHVKEGQGVIVQNCPFKISNQGFDHFKL